MAGILCDEGISDVNALLVAAMVAAGYQVGLFTNNHTPVYGDTLGSFTEASFGGYARNNLASPTNTGTSGNINLETFAASTFNPTGTGLPVTIYGYFIVNSGASRLTGAELFTVPITISIAGQALNVTPSLSYQDRTVA
jgi:hypothetical protein